MAVRQSRFMRRRLRELGRGWGEWENRKWVAAREDAPRGLVDGWCNDRFAVQLFRLSGREWLSIRKHEEGATPPTWAEMQRIKNELVGHEREAVQVFPKDSELVDEANMYHLWLYPDDEECPFNFKYKGWL